MTVTRKFKPKLKLKGYMMEHSISQGDMALVVGLSTAHLNRKLNGNGVDFTATEIEKICLEYCISADVYFFNLNVS
ncbi:helix-turn-helix transcriptional regulator [Listeria booriae]|uniref:helix-turn-helix domain-containing protein n=1 Tax=Listeria booriae TaxID=1552123 RepID=UPI0016255B5E|nr:helix-turn-helix transcriptional regulator [Listeria booriae]MBC2367799.1 helix-turn-helix transcriptional regulator [Listeria booriae]